MILLYCVFTVFIVYFNIVTTININSVYAVLTNIYIYLYLYIYIYQFVYNFIHSLLSYVQETYYYILKPKIKQITNSIPQFDKIYPTFINNSHFTLLHSLLRFN